MTDATNPGMSVTIKSKAGHDATWQVFHGGPDQIASQMRRYFGLTDEQVGGMTVHQLAEFCTEIAQGKRSIAASSGAISRDVAPVSQEQAIETAKSVLGGEVIKDQTGDAAWDAAEAGSITAAAPAQQADNSGLVESLTNAPTEAALKRLWVENKSAFDDKAVKRAYAVRLRALKAQG